MEKLFQEKKYLKVCISNLVSLKIYYYLQEK